MRRIIGLLLLLGVAFSAFPKSPMVVRHYQIASPQASMVVEIPVSSFSLSYEGTPLLQDAQIALHLSDGTEITLGGRIIHTSHEENVMGEKETLSPELAFLADGYNAFRMEYENGFGIEWLVADNGIAYRWYAVASQTSVFPIDEKAFFPFSSDKNVYLSYIGKENNPYLTNRQKRYSLVKLSEGTGKPANLPVFVDCGTVILSIDESGRTSYPKMALTTDTERNSLNAVFPSAPSGQFRQKPEDSDIGQCSPWRIVSLYSGSIRSLQRKTVFPRLILK